MVLSWVHSQQLFYRRAILAVSLYLTIILKPSTVNLLRPKQRAIEPD